MKKLPSLPTLHALSLILIAGMFAGSALLYPSLPNRLPMHWNITGQVDNWMPKPQAIWLLPIFTLLLWLLLQTLPWFDPKKAKYRHFAREWTIIQLTFVAFMAYLHGTILYVALFPQVKMLPLLFWGLGAFLIILGNYLPKIHQNYFIGIRVPWTLASETNWNKTHRFAKWWFMGAGVAILIEAVTLWFAPEVIFAGLMLATAMPILYSFLLFKKVEYKIKYVYLGLIVAALCVLGIRLS